MRPGRRKKNPGPAVSAKRRDDHKKSKSEKIKAILRDAKYEEAMKKIIRILLKWNAKINYKIENKIIPKRGNKSETTKYLDLPQNLKIYMRNRKNLFFGLDAPDTETLLLPEKKQEEPDTKTMGLFSCSPNMTFKCLHYNLVKPNYYSYLDNNVHEEDNDKDNMEVKDEGNEEDNEEYCEEYNDFEDDEIKCSDEGNSVIYCKGKGYCHANFNEHNIGLCRLYLDRTVEYGSMFNSYVQLFQATINNDVDTICRLCDLRTKTPCLVAAISEDHTLLDVALEYRSTAALKQLIIFAFQQHTILLKAKGSNEIKSELETSNLSGPPKKSRRVSEKVPRFVCTIPPSSILKKTTKFLYKIRM